MTRYNRDQIGLRDPRPGPGRLDPEHVHGIALHWPAMSDALRGPAAVMAALRAWQAFHMDERGWSDIAYQEAVDQDGNVYDLRGLRNQSGANGNATVNQSHGALLLVLAPGEQPTAKMIAATRRRIAKHRSYFPNSRRVVGHSALRQTSCPGPAVLALIEKGTFR